MDISYTSNRITYVQTKDEPVVDMTSLNNVEMDADDEPEATPTPSSATGIATAKVRKSRSPLHNTRARKSRSPMRLR
jgi:hypothetical protein